MDTFLQNTFYLAIPIALVLFIQFVWHLHKNRKNEKLLFRAFFGFALLIVITLVPYFLIQHLTSEPECITQDEVEEYEENGWDYDCYYLENFIPIEEDSTNMLRHFTHVEDYKKMIECRTQIINKSASSYFHDWESQKIVRLYTSYINAEDTSIQDIGRICLALHLVNMDRPTYLAQFHLDKVKDRNFLFYNYVQGITHYDRHSWNYYEKAEQSLLLSVENEEYPEGSYSALGHLYRSFGEEEKLRALVYNPETSQYLPSYLKRITYFNDFNLTDYWELLLSEEMNSWYLPGVFAAAFLLFIWLYFLRKMDIYEVEKRYQLVLVFLISIVSMQLLYPMHDFLWEVLGYYRPTNPVSDLWYMTISIGMIEEAVKILPVLIMLKFTKAINEPFDYILYASVSALGFAFMENIAYFDHGLFNISIRGFYCCIVHMAFSATVGYGLMLAKYRKYNKVLLFTGFFVLASFFHGLYDYFLMDWWAIQYEWVSDIILLVMMQLWVLYANNTLNISNFYKPNVNFQAEKMKYLLLIVSISILMIGYVAVGIVYGPDWAADYLKRNSFHLGFFMLFLVLSMGSMRIIRGYISPLTFPLRRIFPTPRKLKEIGGHIQLQPTPKFKIDSELLEHPHLLEQIVKLNKRVIIDDNLESYLVDLSYPIPVKGHLGEQLIAIPVWDNKKLNHHKRTLVQLYLIPDEDIFSKPVLNTNDFTSLGKLYSTSLKDKE